MIKSPDSVKKAGKSQPRPPNAAGRFFNQLRLRTMTSEIKHGQRQRARVAFLAPLFRRRLKISNFRFVVVVVVVPSPHKS